MTRFRTNKLNTTEVIKCKKMFKKLKQIKKQNNNNNKHQEKHNKNKITRGYKL